MIRLVLVVIGFLLGSVLLGAQELGRTDRLWKEYLNQSVRRGLPLVEARPELKVVPFWPGLIRARSDAVSLEKSSDITLIGSWIDRYEGDNTSAVQALRQSWPRPVLRRIPSGLWGETLFFAWDPSSDTREWTQAWLAWEEKAYHPRTLVRGIEVLEQTDPSSVPPLLNQLVRLYPEDRRWLPLAVRHPSVVSQAGALIARDLSLNGGWSSLFLRSILMSKPSVRELLVKSGYKPSQMDQILSEDYGYWLSSAPSQGKNLHDGSWFWDADTDGYSESHLIVQNGAFVTWSRYTEAGLWTLSLQEGRPSSLTESRSGARWTLRYDSYPLAKELEYRWGSQSILFRFRPLSHQIPLWPTERFSDTWERLPVALAELWLPLDPRGLALDAASVETWNKGIRLSQVFLFQGQAWLSIEDSNGDGNDDQWSYYRSGALASVYRDPSGLSQPNLRELYRQGELTQVQSRSGKDGRTEFVLFPEGVQLWDPYGQGRPLDRVFLWSGKNNMSALVFSGANLPWETMPQWEYRP